MTRRVVITGMGILSPLGRGLQTNWDKLTRGVSGISAIRAFDTENFTSLFPFESNPLITIFPVPYI